jgi:hypothetical protein
MKSKLSAALAAAGALVLPSWPSVRFGDPSRERWGSMMRTKSLFGAAVTLALFGGNVPERYRNRI